MVYMYICVSSMLCEKPRPPLWHPARTMRLLLTWRNGDKRKVTGITCANVQHLNYLLRFERRVQSTTLRTRRESNASSHAHAHLRHARQEYFFLFSPLSTLRLTRDDVKEKIHCVSNERYFSSTVHDAVKFTRLTPFAGKNEFFNARPGRVSLTAGVCNPRRARNPLAVKRVKSWA